MGDFRVRKINDAEDRRKMYQFALDDISAFELMLKENMFENGPLYIGAEQELCLVDKSYNPSPCALHFLDNINDEHYTNELALFNLEINLDPFRFQDNCFSKMEKQLLKLLNKGHEKASELDAKILMAGILPTLKYRHLQFDHMTPIQRYQTLSQTLFDIRGSKFEIYLQGVDELIMSLESVLFEACNTSFQLHLQIRANEFVDQHNWSQMIAGPVLSACVNSPMLFGRELWEESRIALFKQSLDTRSSERYIRKKLARVYFGTDWLRESATELWKNDIMRFPLLVTSDDFQKSTDLLAKGEIPDLRAIRLHNGTTYTWNRLCYGFSKKKPHLRIECRYLPAGPTAIDEMANFALWAGLMRHGAVQGSEFWKTQDYRITKNNFIKSARTGLNTVFQWFGENIPAKQLLLEKLLPMARKGLQDSGVGTSDIDKYLGVIEKRVEQETTGSDWTVRNFRALSEQYGEAIAQKEIVRQSMEYQRMNLPLYQWDDIQKIKQPVAQAEATVEQLMSTDILSVGENDSIELVRSILEWNHIHHLPVENQDGDLVGLITDGMMKRLQGKKAYAKDIMLKNFFSIQPQDIITKAKRLMDDQELSGLPVVFKNKLVGILTKRDF